MVDDTETVLPDIPVFSKDVYPTKILWLFKYSAKKNYHCKYTRVHMKTSHLEKGVWNAQFLIPYSRWVDLYTWLWEFWKFFFFSRLENPKNKKTIRKEAYQTRFPTSNRSFSNIMDQGKGKRSIIGSSHNLHTQDLTLFGGFSPVSMTARLIYFQDLHHFNIPSSI